MIGLIGLFRNDQHPYQRRLHFLWPPYYLDLHSEAGNQKERKVAAQQNAGDTEVSMIFRKQNIVMSSPNNELKKDWSELAQYRKTKKGIHFNFADGTEAWLPLDAFYEANKKQFPENK